MAFDEAVGFHLANVVPELGERVCRRFQTEAGQDGLVDLGGAPPGDLRSAVEKNFHQANYPRVVDLDSGDLDLADNNRKCQALKEVRSRRGWSSEVSLRAAICT